jgi:hypothetical protein
LMQSEKRKKELKCFEARIGRGDELPFNFDRTRLSTLDKDNSENQPYCYMLRRADSPEEDTIGINEPSPKRLQ